MEHRGGLNAGLRPCWEGGANLGQQSRNLTWGDVKALGGAGMRFTHAGNANINAYQADNMEDAINLRSADPSNPNVSDEWTIRNWYVIYNRDDCIENDHLTSGTVSDSLFDGCFVFLSADDVHALAPDQSSETIVIDHAVVWHQLQPSETSPLTDTGRLFKWDPFAPTVVVRNSVFLLDDPPGAGEWPPGTVLKNVTIVLKGPGTLSLNMLPGMTVTTDFSVWNNAKADWLTRHGCSEFVPGVGASCTQQAYPTPPA